MICGRNEMQPIYRQTDSQPSIQEMPLTIARLTAAIAKTGRNASARRAGLFTTLALFGSLAASQAAYAQSAAAEGEKIAFDRSKGNCLTCHEMKGGTLAGSIGPAPR